MTPVFFTSTYVQPEPAKAKGYEYSRTGNPTRTALEKAIAELEGGKHGLCFSSGMSAIDTVLRTLSSGDHVVAGDDLYGGTYRIATKVYRRFGVEFTFVNTADPQLVKRALRKETKLVWIETPSNPLLRITDIAAVAKVAREHGALSAVDNTFATPYIQRPLELGADIVVHSVTKYLSGHSDVVGGALVVNSEDLRAKLAFLQNAVGGVPGPMDCFLVHRGLKTLHLRMAAHNAGAQRVASFLAEHPKVAKVHFPGLPSHAGHDVAKRQMNGFGGMVSFELKGSVEDGKKLCTKTRLFSLAESLGGVESLIEHPPTMTHGSIEPHVRRAAGLQDGLIRLSVGVEDPDDLVQDLEQALAQV
jgi:cystathionine beta-lyase/cystathionine gamma-synthase